MPEEGADLLSLKRRSPLRVRRRRNQRLEPAAPARARRKIG
jgi:hypothetical protein